MDLKKTSNFVFKTSIKLVIVLLLVFALYLVASKSFEFGEKIFAGSDISYSDAEEVVVTIPVGASTAEVADILKKNGLIDDALAFKVQAVLFEAKFTPGNYKLRTSYNVEEILDALKEKPEEETT